MDHVTTFFAQAWAFAAALDWLAKGISDGLIILLVGRLVAYGYREHAYLYQFEDRGRTIDNWIKFLAPYVRALKLVRYRAFLATALARAGGRRDWETDHFLAFQLVCGAVMAVLAHVVLVLLLNWSFAFVIVLGVMGFVIPGVRLADTAAARFKSCNKDLPFFIDYLALAMGAGLDFNQGMERVVADAPKSPLAEEFRLVLRNMRLGMSRAEALQEMERRMESPVLKLFVQTLVQAMELGTDVGHTLTVISETLTQKRFQVAEEMAGKISVRMMIPMMLFVMPSVMIILLGPMILSYLATT